MWLLSINHHRNCHYNYASNHSLVRRALYSGGVLFLRINQNSEHVHLEILQTYITLGYKSNKSVQFNICHRTIDKIWGRFAAIVNFAWIRTTNKNSFQHKLTHTKFTCSHVLPFTLSSITSSNEWELTW